MCEHCTRREFIGTSVAAGMMLAGANWKHAWASQSAAGRFPGKFRICVVITGRPVPDTENITSKDSLNECE